MGRRETDSVPTRLRRRGRRKTDRAGGVGDDRFAHAPSLDSRWVILVEDGEALAAPYPCLFEERFASLEAETAMHGARPGVTARVGTMRLLLSLGLGLRAEDFIGKTRR